MLLGDEYLSVASTQQNVLLWYHCDGSERKPLRRFRRPIDRSILSSYEEDASKRVSWNHFFFLFLPPLSRGVPRLFRINSSFGFRFYSFVSSTIIQQQRNRGMVLENSDARLIRTPSSPIVLPFGGSRRDVDPSLRVLFLGV